MRLKREDETPATESLRLLDQARDEFRSSVEREAAKLLASAKSRADAIKWEAERTAHQLEQEAAKERQLMADRRAELFSKMLESVDRLERDFAETIREFRRELEGVASRPEVTTPSPAMQSGGPQPSAT